MVKETVNQTRRMKEIFASYLSEEELLYRMYKELKRQTPEK